MAIADPELPYANLVPDDCLSSEDVATAVVLGVAVVISLYLVVNGDVSHDDDVWTAVGSEAVTKLVGIEVFG